MRYIRRIENPLRIKASGFVGPGGLGDFDPNIYEEIEGFPPPNAIHEDIRPLNERLDLIFKELPDPGKAAFYTLKSAVKSALESGDTIPAKIIIQNADLSNMPALEEYRQALLAEFNR